MSLTTIRTGVVAILTAAGCKNVTAEELVTLDAPEALAERLEGDRPHFWIVRAERAPGVGGAGFVDRTHRFSIEGYVGMSRDNPADGTTSDVTVSALWDAVIAALESPANAHPGNAIDFLGVTSPSMRVTTVRLGTQRVSVHSLRTSVTYLEAN